MRKAHAKGRVNHGKENIARGGMDGYVDCNLAMSLSRTVVLRSNGLNRGHIFSLRTCSRRYPKRERKENEPG